MSPAPSPQRKVGIRYPTWSSCNGQVLRGVGEHMRVHGPWDIATGNNSYGEMETISLDADWEGDGLILFRATVRELESFKSKGISVVLTSSEGPDLGYPRVVPDNDMIGRIAARHLLECSVPHFAFLARGETFYKEEEYAPGFRRYARERLAGYREELLSYQIEPQVHYLRGWPLWQKETWREIEDEVSKFLLLLPRPCGLFVVDDALGAVALRAAGKLGIRVPEEIAIIGYGDDISYCFACHPALSSIPFPGVEIGRQASLLLASMMEGGAPPQSRVKIPVHSAIERDSTATLAVEDPEIQKLVRYIRLNAPHDAIRVAELAELSDLSITTIKTRFLQYLGHGPKHEIQRIRLKHLTHLLSHTQLGLSEISALMKFNSAGDMSRFFASETGKRPSEFRSSIKRSNLSDGVS